MRASHLVMQLQRSPSQRQLLSLLQQQKQPYFRRLVTHQTSPLAPECNPFSIRAVSTASLPMLSTADLSTQKLSYLISPSHVSHWSRLGSRDIFTSTSPFSQNSLRRDISELLQAEKESSISMSVWVVRLANENGYLSWCRNGYLATVVAVGMEAEGKMPLTAFASETVFVVAGMNLAVGTVLFVYNVLKLRPHLGFSRFGVSCCVIGPIAHLCLWLLGLLTYSGYIVDDDS